MNKLMLSTMAFLVASFGQAFAVQYTITDLGGSNNSISIPYPGQLSINDNGQVAGTKEVFVNNGYYNRAFLYDSGAITDLGTLNSGDISEAFDINNSGQIVGSSHNYDYFSVDAFLYDGGTMQELSVTGVITPRDAMSINDNGWIAGVGFNGNSELRAFLHDGTAMHDIGMLPGSVECWPRAMNNNGFIVGDSDMVNDQFLLSPRAFLYDGDSMQNLGTLGGTEAWAWDINEGNLVVGGSQVSTGEWHAFLYEDGTMLDLGVSGRSNSSAKAINDTGQIVGYGYDTIYHDEYYSEIINMSAFLHEDGVMIDLNTLIPAESGWTLESALDINNAGQIVGYGMFEGQQRAFLMTPVPEPATLALLAFGGILIRKNEK